MAQIRENVISRQQRYQSFRPCRYQIIACGRWLQESKEDLRAFIRESMEELRGAVACAARSPASSAGQRPSSATQH